MGRKGIPIAVGQQFGRLTVLSFVGSSAHGDRIYECACECGRKTTATASSLVAGNKKSCGCLHGENHGHADDRLYSIWCTMKARCGNPNNHRYKSYGGRGIRVCDEWQHSFKAFYDWAMSSGYDYDAPYGQCTIDRIDVDGDYEPTNCRWVDAGVQAFNKRPCEYKSHGIEIDYGGKHYTSIKDLAREYDIHPARIERRIHRMSVDEALNEIRASIITDDGLLKSVRYVSEKQWESILKLQKCGLSQKAIEERLRISKNTIRDVINRHRSGLGPYKNELPVKLLGRL